MQLDGLDLGGDASQVFCIDRTGQVFPSVLSSDRGLPDKCSSESWMGIKRSPGQRPRALTQYAPVFKTGAPANRGGAGSIPVRPRLRL